MATTMSKHKKSAVHYTPKKQAAPGNKLIFVNFFVAVILILAGIVVLFWLGRQSVAEQSSRQAAAPAMPQQGQPAPNFTLTSIEGQPVSLSDFSGQVVLVNTWATWCPPCKAEMPTLHTYYQQHKAEGFVVLAVNSQEDAGTVSAFIQQNGFNFPVVLDSHAAMMNQYNVLGLPTSFIIGRDGLIKYVHTGEITKDQLDRVISPLL
ncbi:MAG: Thiol-disulfide oxidoreductase ResA [Anaerolineae bacterium]|nr:Thiol-disulfide oxidoreductase ResA [Anaerolineae bacterium]